jgi:hypothetical protein
MNTGFISWSDREPPLEACAVAAWGDVARRLASHLLELDQTALGRLTGVAGKSAIVLLGEETNLPWVDGVLYLGRDPVAPTLLLPTRIESAVPATNLLERALRKRFSNLSPPLAILPDTLTVISCYNALQLSRSRIEAWLAEEKP